MRKIDFALLCSVVFLTLFGLFMIYDVSSYVAFRDFQDKFHYVKGQIFWVAIGFGLLTFFTYFDYRKLYNLSLPILISALVFLILVFIPGIGVHALGAKRWIDARLFIIQPVEFAKLALSIYLASWFSHKERGRFPAFVLLVGLILFLVILQPDMGSSLVILSEALIVYFLSGGNLLYFAAGIPVTVIISLIFIKISPYRYERLKTFLDFNQSAETSSYHVKQILIALGSGGFFGVGLGNSIQKYAYLPETTTDSIFAIIAEETGFIGATLIVLVFAFVMWRGFLIAVKTKDNFGKLLGGGIITFLSVQTIINLSAQTVLVPLTGIPLPFISYGGSSLILDLSAIGILLNISKHTL